LSPSSADLIERGDLDELTRHVEGLCSQRDWEALLDLRDRCRKALERGKQLWPVASHCEYRLALEAPGEWAAQMLVPGTGQFALGPLPEVAASTHAFADLAPWLVPGPPAAVFAHERVIRGEDLSDNQVALALPPVLELPLSLVPTVETDYTLAEYHPDRAEFPMPDVPPTDHYPLRTQPATHFIQEPEPVRALLDVTQTWVTGSNGRATAVAVRGDAINAIEGLGAPSPRIRTARLTPSRALALLAWAGASGGSHGNRRGAASGRFAAWWVVAALTDQLDDWPLAPSEFADAASELEWHAWDAGEPDTGWWLRLAVEDGETGRAFAVGAVDA
jgi:hypothetical protein